MHDCPEAEDYARCAVGLAPGNPIASRTLSDVLACLGKVDGSAGLA